MKNHRKLKIGEVIRWDDVFCDDGEKPIRYKADRIGTRVCPVGTGAVNKWQDASPSYRPLKKPVEKWKVLEVAASYWVVGDKYKEERARVWKKSDAYKICRAINKMGEI